MIKTVSALFGYEDFCTNTGRFLQKKRWAWSRSLILYLGMTALYLPASACFGASNLMGVNISGAEFNPGLGKRLNFDYVYPNPGQLDYYAGKGFGVIRLPFDMNRLYPVAFADLSSTELNEIRKTIAYAEKRGLLVILDPHNYGYIRDSRSGAFGLIGRDEVSTKLFVDFWRRVARQFRDTPNVIFGLMNEPNKQTPSEWRIAAEKVVKIIRAAGADQMVLIPGTFFTGAHSWASPGGNGAAWAGYNGDPRHNFAFEMHQYLDSDNSGMHAQCTANAGAERLSSATEWLRQNNAKGFLGEFAWSVDESCRIEKAAFLKKLAESKDVWIGWSWWAGGVWWPPSYPFNLEPIVNKNGRIKTFKDRPQLEDLTKLVH